MLLEYVEHRGVDEGFAAQNDEKSHADLLGFTQYPIEDLQGQIFIHTIILSITTFTPIVASHGGGNQHYSGGVQTMLSSESVEDLLVSKEQVTYHPG